MDDARIHELAEEVLSQLRSPSAAEPSDLEGRAAEPSDLEGRVAALEAVVRELLARIGQTPGAHAMSAPAEAARVASTTVVVTQTESAPAAGASHPALALLGPSGGGTGACVLEPDKPCVGSGQCRSFGH